MQFTLLKKIVVCQLERWSEYFGEILNRPQPTIFQSPRTLKATSKIDEIPSSMNEIKLAILNLASGKSPGPDCIDPKMLKVNPLFMVKTLQPIFN
jgi:hypothetical protein